MTTRASIIVWSAGAGLLIGLLIDAGLIGIWMVVSSAIPSISPRNYPKWATAITVAALVAVPLVAGLLGYLEGRLKAS